MLFITNYNCALRFYVKISRKDSILPKVLWMKISAERLPKNIVVYFSDSMSKLDCLGSCTSIILATVTGDF